MKSFDEFIKSIIEELSGRYEKAKIEVKKVIKNNGKILTGLIILEKDTNIAPTIYLDSYYEECMKGKTIDWAVHEIIGIYEKNKMPKIDISFFMDYGKVKDKIAFKVVNYNRNKALLKDIPHFRFLDLAIIFYCVISKIENQEASITIANNHLKIWNVDQEDIYTWAKSNTKRILPWEICDMADVIDQVVENNDLSHGMYVLTNSQKSYGAACIAYDGVLNEIAQKWDSDFYILPSSVHEVILVPTSDKEDMKELSDMVKQINDSILSQEEILSDHAYYFSKEKGIIEM